MISIPDPLQAALARPLPQRRFRFNLAQWDRWLGNYSECGPLIKSLPQGGLDRSDVASLVEREIDQNLAGAFMVSMIWGHGTSNYGAFRTARVLTAQRSAHSSIFSVDVISRLESSVTLVRTEGAVKAFEFLNNVGKIRWLGPAFFTKWLYFSSARGSLETFDAAPVLDAVIVRWFWRECGLALKIGSTADYERYIAILASWGEPISMSASQVEQQIFRIIRNDAAVGDVA